MSQVFCAAILVICCGELATGEIYFRNGSPQVKLTEKAGLTGHIRDGRPFASFEGVPFAKIPTRFAAAELLSIPDWEGFKNVTTPGELCSQPGGATGVVGIENCLTLAVHVPLAATKRFSDLPVMVHIHGGGLLVGTGSGFRGSFFMDDGEVILVSINYRLGILGFLSTKDDVIPGNNGLKDQVVALRWIQEFISKFGGNKNSVTVFGESSGGTSSHYLKLSETTKSLIHRVISQSGVALNPVFVPNPKETAVMLANYMKCETNNHNTSEISSEEIASCLRKASVEDMWKAAGDFKPSWPAGAGGSHFGPVAEPQPSASSENIPFITESPLDIMKKPNGPNQDIPLLTGIVKDEGMNFAAGIVANEDLLGDLDTNWNEIASKIFFLDRFLLPNEQIVFTKSLKSFYFSDEPLSYERRQDVYNLYSDMVVNYGVRKSVEIAASKGEEVYLYHYSYVGKKSFLEIFYKIPNEDKLVSHADDVYYQDQKPDIIPGMGGNGEPLVGQDEEFSRNFVRLWTSFAINGKPIHSWGNSSENKWTPVTTEEANGKDPLKYYNVNLNPSFIQEPFTPRIKFLDVLIESLAGNRGRNGHVSQK